MELCLVRSFTFLITFHHPTRACLVVPNGKSDLLWRPHGEGCVTHRSGLYSGNACGQVLIQPAKPSLFLTQPFTLKDRACELSQDAEDRLPIVPAGFTIVGSNGSHLSVTTSYRLCAYALSCAADSDAVCLVPFMPSLKVMK